MEPMFRKALRKHRELRNQFENCLLGDDGEIWEAQARNFLAKRPCWVSGQVPLVAKTIVPDIASNLDLWQKYYRDSHKLDLDLGGIRIPVKQDGFNRLVVVAQGLTLNRLVEVARKKYQMWLYHNDLDRVIVHNDRNSTETYAIWVRDRQEADEEMANQSADDIWFKKLTVITLLERLILGDEEFTYTGRHLDEDNITLCAGSRHSDGIVPHVHWYRGPRRVCVYWHYPQERLPHLRCRLAVA